MFCCFADVLRTARVVRVAVGTRVAQRPPHRSRRAALPHRALTSGSGGKEALFRPWMLDLGRWQPASDVETHLSPVEPAFVAATAETAAPAFGNLQAETAK